MSKVRSDRSHLEYVFYKVTYSQQLSLFFLKDSSNLTVLKSSSIILLIVFANLPQIFLLTYNSLIVLCLIARKFKN